MLTVVNDTRSLDAGGVEQFLHRWYGLEGGSHAVAAESFVPAELKTWHEAVARAGVSVAFQDYPIPLNDLSPRPGGLLPFWVENQHGFEWAVKLDDPGNQVHFRESGSEDWWPTGEDLEDFLLHCTIREAIIGAAEKFTVFVAESLLNDALESFKMLKFPALASEEPETRIWSSLDALARVTVPPVGYENPGEKIWMVTVAVAGDASIQKYGSRFNIENSDVVPTLADVSDEAPPF